MLKRVYTDCPKCRKEVMIRTLVAGRCNDCRRKKKKGS